MARIVLVLLVLACAAPAGATTGSGRPHVWLVDRSPAVVRGAAFKPAERVAVKVSVGDLVLSKAVVASASGAFVARWRRGVPVGCVATSVSASGSQGSHASFKTPTPDCAPLQPAGQ